MSKTFSFSEHKMSRNIFDIVQGFGCKIYSFLTDFSWFQYPWSTEKISRHKYGFLFCKICKNKKKLYPNDLQKSFRQIVKQINSTRGWYGKP